jgi:hypothetical protein
VVSVSVIFFTFALGAWVIGLYLVGMGSEPAEGGGNPLVTVGWIEVVVGVILFSQVFIIVQQDAGVVLAGLVVLFAVFFTSFGVALVKGADLRPIGNLAIPVGILAALYVDFLDFTEGESDFIFQSSAIWWGVVFLLVAGFTYGKVPAKVLGWALVITGLWGFLPAVLIALNQRVF